MNVLNVKFSLPNIGRNGKQYVYLNEHNDKLKLSIKNCGNPFGINEYNGRHSINLQFKNPETKGVFNDLVELDTKIIDYASVNSFSWFKKNIHESVIKELYKSQLQMSDKFPPTFRANLDKMTQYYDVNGNQIELSNVKKGDQLNAELENTGIYFTNSNFSSSWKVTSLTVTGISQKTQMSGYSFVDDE